MSREQHPPHMGAYGSISKILTKIKEAKTPERFTGDFLETNLGIKGGNYKAVIPLFKRIGLLSSDGSPTDLYKSFRNPSTSGSAIAEALRKGYRALFDRNEYANKLNKQDLEGLLIQITGLERGDGTLRNIIGTFEALKAFADFNSESKSDSTQKQQEDQEDERETPVGNFPNISFGYTINLNLPKTDDIKVFNAIFRSLRENLLK